MLRHVLVGVGIAVLICTGIPGSACAPQRGTAAAPTGDAETVIGLAAVAIVTFAIFWMRRHARGMKSEQKSASSAWAEGSAGALIGMAFFAVLRRGIETVVFLLAIFRGAEDATAAGLGTGAGHPLVHRDRVRDIPPGGVRLNLSRFFKLTAVVLVFVAAGLLSNSVHTAGKPAGLPSWGQAVDLSWLVVPGTWTSALPDRDARPAVHDDRSPGDRLSRLSAADAGLYCSGPKPGGFAGRATRSRAQPGRRLGLLRPVAPKGINALRSKHDDRHPSEFCSSAFVQRRFDHSSGRLRLR